MKLLIAAAMLTVAFAGCTDDEAEFETPPQDGEGRYVIEMTDSLQFEPRRAEVPVGSTVVWKNVGNIPHDTESADGGWDSETFSGGQEFETTVDTAGEFAYRCTLHADMTGVLRVV